MYLVYPTSICKWDIHDLYNYTRLIRAMHNSYESALALRVLFYFLRSLYIYNSPYLTRDTYYRLIKYITFGVLLCVTHSDHLAIPIAWPFYFPLILKKLEFNFNSRPWQSLRGPTLSRGKQVVLACIIYLVSLYKYIII
jgi:hypothetical protein